MIHLYSLSTPNGQKASVALEELGLTYTPHTINILTGEQFTPEFMALNPNSKIPVLVDEDGPNGSTVTIVESGAILLYLAEKTGKLLSTDPVLRMETIQWVFFQMANIGPMFGQFGHFFKYAKDRCLDPYPLGRYTTETKRLLNLLDDRLANREWLVGEAYSIADIAIFPWIECLGRFYDAEEQLQLSEYLHVQHWLDRCLSRPAVKQGMSACSDF
jgi:GSH-dependent disulfide-bond oxidoreductase